MKRTFVQACDKAFYGLFGHPFQIPEGFSQVAIDVNGHAANLGYKTQFLTWNNLFFILPKNRNPTTPPHLQKRTTTMLRISVQFQDQILEYSGKLKQLKKIGQFEWIELEEVGQFPLQDVISVNGIELC